MFIRIASRAVTALLVCLAVFHPGTAGATGTTPQSVFFTDTYPVDTYVGGTATFTATATSGLPVTISVATPALCTISGSTVTFTAAGQCNINATQAGNATYAPASNSFGILAEVGPLLPTQVITVNLPSAMTVNGTYSIGATANSGRGVIFQVSPSNVCFINIDMNVLTAAAPGYCYVEVLVGATSSYADTELQTYIPVTGSVLQTQTITVHAPASINVGGTGVINATASSGLPVTLVSNSPAVCSVSGNVVTGLIGSYCTITATQAGNATYAAVSTLINLPINAPVSYTTSVTLVGANSVGLNTTVSLTCIVNGNPAPASPLTGTVQLIDNGNVTGTTASLSNGTAYMYPSWATAGVHQLQCSYPGNGTYPAATSSAITVQSGVTESVEVFPVTLSILSMTAGTPFVVKGIIYDNTVGSVAVFTNATGTVTFYDGSTVIGSAPVVNGVGSTLVTITTSGPHTLKAVYSGDSVYPQNSGSLQINFLGAVTVLVSSSQNPSPPGQNVSFIATINGSSYPAGSVTFNDGSTALGTAQLVSQGQTSSQATFTTSSLAAGVHLITAMYGGDSNNGSATSAQFAQAIGTIAPQTGYWWNPAEGGRGFVIEIQGTSLLMAGFLYDTTGRATWVESTGQMTTSSQYSGTLSTFSGGQTLTGSYQPATQGPSLGSISIAFNSNTQGTLTWPGGTIPIQRFDIVPGGSTSAQPATNPQTGWWWNPGEGGRGFAVEVQNGAVYLASYMYDASGNPVWYLTSGSLINGTTFQSVWQQFANGQTLTGNYHAPSVVNANAGNVTVQFSGPATATLTLPDGRQIPFVRYQFSASATGGGQHTGLTQLSALAGAGDWATYQGNNAHTGYVPVTLNPSVFGLRWSWSQPQPSNTADLEAQTLLSVAVTGNNQVYVTSSLQFDARLYALKEYDASQVWMYETNKGGEVSIGPPTFANGKVFVIGAPPSGGPGTSLLWFNAADGTLPAGSPVSGATLLPVAPTVNGNLVYVTDTYEYTLDARNVTTGAPVFGTGSITYNPGAGPSSVPAVDSSNVYVYGQLGFTQAGLVVLDALSGAKKTTIYDDQGDSPTVSNLFVPILGAPGSVIASNYGAYLSRYDINASRVVWQVTENLVNGAAYHAGVIYIESAGLNRLEARAEADASLLWSWSPPSAFDKTFVSDVLLTQNLAFVSTNYAVYAIDLNTHQAVWTYPRSGHLALSANGVLYIVSVDSTGNSDGTLVAINVQ